MTKTTATTKKDSKSELKALYKRVAELEDTLKKTQQEREAFKLCFNYNSIGLAIASADQKWIFVNDYIVQLFGYSRKIFFHAPWTKTLNLDEIAGYNHLYKCLLIGEINNFAVEKQYARKDNSFFWVEISFTAVRQTNGDILYILVTIQDISARKKQENFLMGCEGIIACASDLIALIDSNYRYIAVNKAYAAAMNLSMSDLVGCSTRNFFDSEVFETVLWPNGQRCLRGEEFQFQNWITYPKLGRRYVNIAYSPYIEADGKIRSFVICVRDLTVAYEAEEKRRHAEKQYRMLFQSMINGFALHEIVYDDHGNLVDFRYLEVNHAFEKITGIKAEQIIGRTALDILPGTVTKYFDEYKKVAITGIPFHVVNYSAESGKYYDLVAYRPSEGLFAVVFADVTEIKKMELAKQQFERQLLQTQKLESLGILAGGVAHDFNNILMAILGQAEMALKETDALSPLGERLIQINKAGQRAADLCRQMLAYSGKGNFIIEPIDFSELVGEMVHFLQTNISKKIAFNLSLNYNIPPIKGDATQIRQVLMNLIINSAEAIGNEQGTISVQTGIMNCSLVYLQQMFAEEELPAGDYVFLEVIDTGCGMDQVTLAKIFDPFFTTKFTGRGLGMPAILGIIKTHKGAISIASAPGEGTTIKVLFPSSDLVTVPPAALENNIVARAKYEGIVLLVDDEEAVRTVAKSMLEALGFEVLTAGNGHEAIDYYRKYKGKIKLVLLDLIMPYLDGEETLKRLCELDSQVMIVLCSGYAENEIAKRFADKGVVAFLHKPYNLSSLEAKISTLCLA